MNHEHMIASINAEQKAADAETLGLLLQVLRKSKSRITAPLEGGTEVMSDSPSQRAAFPRGPRFISENLPFEAIERLSIKERGALQRSVKDQNKEWLHERFTTLDALWIMVLDGRVEAWGKSMRDYPSTEQIMEICRNSGKYPFIFINDERMAIEESTSVWQGLKLDEYYPTRFHLPSKNALATLIVAS